MSPRISARQPISPRKNPAKLKEMQDAIPQEAIKFGVYPMDDRSFAAVERRPMPGGPTSWRAVPR